MTLNGTLEDFSPAGILKVLASEGRTGAVRFGGDCTVYLHRGQLYFARDERTDEALATALVRPGRLSADDWAHAIEQAGDRPLVGELLVRDGAIAPDLLASVVLSVMYDPLITLFHHGGSDFQFEPDTVHWLGPFRAFPVDAIVTEVRRRVREADEWATTMPSLDVWVEAKRTLPGNAAQVTLLREDWELVAALSGPRTIDDLAAELGRGRYSTARVVRRLHDAGLVAVIAGSEEAEVVQLRPSAPASEPEASGAAGPAAVAEPAATPAEPTATIHAFDPFGSHADDAPAPSDDGADLLSLGLPHRTPASERSEHDAPTIDPRPDGPSTRPTVPDAIGERIGQAIAGALADAQDEAPGFGPPSSSTSLPRRALHHDAVDHDGPWTDVQPAVPEPTGTGTPPVVEVLDDRPYEPTFRPATPAAEPEPDKNPNAAWLEDLYAQFIDEPEVEGNGKKRRRNEPNPVDVAFKATEQSGEAKVSTLKRLMGALKKL